MSSSFSTSTKLLRGGSFVQPNTAAAPAAVLQDDELSAEDLHALTRTSTIMLRPTILLWRQSLNEVAQKISSETKKPTNQIASAPPATIRVIDFKPPPPVTFKGIHRVDGNLNFQWQDRDAVVGGVYQPRVVVGNEKAQQKADAERKKRKEEHEQKQNKNLSGSNDNNDDEDEEEINSYYTSVNGGRKLWRPEELLAKDKIAWETLRQHWRDVTRKVKLEKQQQLQQQEQKGISLSTISFQNNKSTSTSSNQRIRQRKEDGDVIESNLKAPMNSSQNPTALSTTTTTATSTIVPEVEFDLEALLRSAAEVLNR